MCRLGLAVCAAIVLAAMPASADTIASPPIYGSLSQNKLFCYVYNAGSTAISITAPVMAHQHRQNECTGEMNGFVVARRSTSFWRTT